MLRILVVGLVLLVGAMLLLPRGAPPVPAPTVATALPEPRPLPDIELVDTAGRPFGVADLRGEFSLLFFGFTHCPDICPLTLQVLAAARDRLSDATAPRVVFVSVDPYRDTPERIRDYLANFDPDFVGVTGSDEALAPWIQALGVTVHKNERDGEHYNVTHNGTIYVINPDAELIGIFGGTSHEAETVATDFARLRARARLSTAP
jgi:protein SCO1/2